VPQFFAHTEAHPSDSFYVEGLRSHNTRTIFAQQVLLQEDALNGSSRNSARLHAADAAGLRTLNAAADAFADGNVDFSDSTTRALLHMANSGARKQKWQPEV